MYSAGRPYRKTLSTNSRMTLRCTRIWNDSEKFVRASLSSSVWNLMSNRKSSGIIHNTHNSFSVALATSNSFSCFAISCSEYTKSRTMNLSKKGCSMRYWNRKKDVGYCLLLFSAFLNKVIMYTSENNDTEERKFVIGSQKPRLHGHIWEAGFGGRNMIYVEVRGTTMLVSLSYFALQSFTRILGSVNAIVDDLRHRLTWARRPVEFPYTRNLQWNRFWKLRQPRNAQKGCL